MTIATTLTSVHQRSPAPADPPQPAESSTAFAAFLSALGVGFGAARAELPLPQAAAPPATSPEPSGSDPAAQFAKEDNADSAEPTTPSADHAPDEDAPKRRIDTQTTDLSEVAAQELKSAGAPVAPPPQPNPLTQPAPAREPDERADSAAKDMKRTAGEPRADKPDRADRTAPPQGVPNAEHAPPTHAAADQPSAASSRPTDANAAATATAPTNTDSEASQQAGEVAPAQGPNATQAVATPVAASRPAPGPAAATGADKSVRPVAAVGPAGATMPAKDALQKLTGQAPVLRRAVEQQSLVLQAARGMAQALKDGDGTITLNLQPPRLGQLKVHLTMQDASLTARIEPTSAAARQLLVESQHSLRAALEARGLSVERIEVEAVKPPPHTADPTPAPEAHGGSDRGTQPDHPGGDSAGPGDPGGQAGWGAEAHTGEAGSGRRDALEAWGGLAAGQALGSADVTYALDGGGVYRLRLDALA